jgi:acylphosphatase
MSATRHYLIAGRVHGVGFRYFVQQRGAQQGVRGWVRNLAGGMVEVLASGDAAALDRLEAALREGPPLSRVDRVDVHDVSQTPPADIPDGFEIRS